MQYLKEIVDYGIIGILIFMSVLSLSIFIERYLYYKKIDLKSFKNRDKLKNSLTNNLTIIATIASNAPYVGLLGTVIAIMQTFLDIANKDITASTIMASLALALKSTAIGLFVAILAILFYNYLSRKVEVLLVEYEA